MFIVVIEVSLSTEIVNWCELKWLDMIWVVDFETHKLIAWILLIAVSYQVYRKRCSQIERTTHRYWCAEHWICVICVEHYNSKCLCGWILWNIRLSVKPYNENRLLMHLMRIYSLGDVICDFIFYYYEYLNCLQYIESANNNPNECYQQRV